MSNVSKEVSICDLCHELWAMAQGSDAIADAVSRMESAVGNWLRENDRPLIASLTDELRQLEGTASWMSQAERAARIRSVLEGATQP